MQNITQMKHLYISLIFVFSAFVALAQDGQSKSAVAQFSEIISEYSSTKDLGICGPKFDNLCHAKIKCRVENDLIKRIAERSHDLPKTEGTYLFDTYINELVKMIDKGARISIENVEYDRSLKMLDNTATMIKYDIVIEEMLDTKYQYTDVAVIRDGKITAIYQYSGTRKYVAAMQLLLPYLPDLDSYWTRCNKYVHRIDKSKAEVAFEAFREIASSCFGDIARKSMAMMVGMEIAGVGCKNIPKYVKILDIGTYSYYASTNYTPRIPFIVKGWANWWINGYWDLYYFENSHIFYKKHPYYKSKGLVYLQHFYKYRNMTNCDLLYIKRKGNYFGFVDQNGNEVIKCKYNFAFPFDQQSRLSAVRNNENKWGFINEAGAVVIPFIYDNVNDVFVDSKNYVIKDDRLILINSKGEELRAISGYNYLIPKLEENEIIAYNSKLNQYDVFDFYGNLIVENCFPNMDKGEGRFWGYWNDLGTALRLGRERNSIADEPWRLD